MADVVEIRPAAATGYPSAVRDRMTDEQRAELTRRAQAAVDTQAAADRALQERDAYVIALSDAGIGATEIGRCIPGEAADGTTSRQHVHRIVNNYKKRARAAEA